MRIIAKRMKIQTKDRQKIFQNMCLVMDCYPKYTKKLLKLKKKETTNSTSKQEDKRSEKTHHNRINTDDNYHMKKFST